MLYENCSNALALTRPTRTRIMGESTTSHKEAPEGIGARGDGTPYTLEDHTA